MKKLLERIVDTFSYNLGRVPEKEFYLDSHVENGACEVVERLIRGNSDLIRHRDIFGNPLLTLAVNEGRRDMAKLLLSLGCDVNAVDANGATALHVAIETGDIRLVKLLVSFGASGMIADENGDVPLDWADDSQRELFRIIIEKEDGFSTSSDLICSH